MGACVVEISAVFVEDVDIDVLGVLCRSRSPFSDVGAVNSVGGPQEVGQVLQTEFFFRPFCGACSDGERFHQGTSARLVGLIQLDGGQFLCNGDAREDKRACDYPHYESEPVSFHTVNSE